MKKVLLLAALALGFVSANAQEFKASATIKDGKGLFTLTLTGATDYAAMQFDIKFPQGMKMVSHYDEDYEEDRLFYKGIGAGGVLVNATNVECNPQTNGDIRFVIYSNTNKAFKEGNLIMFDVAVDETYSQEDMVISGTILASDEASARGGEGKNIDTFSSVCVPVKVSNSGYATIASPFDIALPSEVKAYDAAISGKFVELSGAAESVTAGKPSILYGSEVEVYAYGVASVEAPSNTGDFVGVFEATPITSGYVLSKGAFQKVTTSATVPAYKAYFNTPIEIKGFRFADDDATAINGVNNAAAGVQGIYGVNGAARSSMVKGVNIIKNADGSVSKVLVK